MKRHKLLIGFLTLSILCEGLIASENEKLDTNSIEKLSEAHRAWNKNKKVFKKVYFMHISGRGSVERLAMAMYAKVHEIRASKPKPDTSFGQEPLPEKGSITAEPLEKILRVKGTLQDGMLKAVFGRVTKMEGEEFDCIFIK
jgi:hypothetical protein